MPAVVGALLAARRMAGAARVFHAGARYVGLAGCSVGLSLYVVYRKSQQKPLLRRVTIPERALRHERPSPSSARSSCRSSGPRSTTTSSRPPAGSAGETRDDVEDEGAVIEAIWVFEMPLALPLDAPLPDAQVRGRARRWRGPSSWARSTRASRWPPRSSAGGVPARRSSARRAAAVSRRSCSAPRSPRACAGARCSAASASARELRRRCHQVRDPKGPLPGDPDGAAGRPAAEPA